MQIKDRAQERIEMLRGELAVLNHQVGEQESTLTRCQKDLQEARHQAEVLKMASSVLQELVDVIAKKNIEKVEQIVNLALQSIFEDMVITFKINQSIKRNINVYTIALYENGVEGSIHSFGGGVVSVVALVLKAIFNVMTQKFPLVVWDESTAFIAQKYLDNTAKFINSLSKDLNIGCLLVTHQHEFVNSANNIISVDKVGNVSVVQHS